MSKRDAQIERLSQVALFAACTKAELRKLAAITTETVTPAGEVLCREGSAGRECYVVMEGEATVSIDGRPLDTVGPGGFFGEMALLDGGPRVATVTADTEMRLLVLSRSEFTSLLADVPSVSRKMLEALGHRLRLAREQATGSTIGV